MNRLGGKTPAYLATVNGPEIDYARVWLVKAFLSHKHALIDPRKWTAACGLQMGPTFMVLADGSCLIIAEGKC